jgi:hypothetical protein
MLTVAVSGCSDCTGGAFEIGERGLLLSSEAARLLISGAWLLKHRLRYDAHELDPSAEERPVLRQLAAFEGNCDRANSS